MEEGVPAQSLHLPGSCFKPSVFSAIHCHRPIFFIILRYKSPPNHLPSSTISDMYVARGIEELNCGLGGGDDSFLGLRIASVFVILVGSTLGALFPVVAKRSSWLHVPKSIFECVLFSLTGFKSSEHISGALASQNTLVRVSLYVYP